MNPTLAWLLVLVCAGSAGALAYLLLERRREREPNLPREWLLTPRAVFNAQERRVYRQLREALPQLVVLAKLPLVRFCQPTDPGQVRYWFELLGGVHVTFAVCSPEGRVLAAIDLDDGRAATRRSQQIKQAVLAACRVRHVRYGPEHTPSVPELQQLVPAAAASGAAPARVGAMATMPGRLRSAATVGMEVVAPRAARASHWSDTQARDSMFGRDSVISGFSHSLPSVLPERGGEVVDGPPLRH